MSNWSLRLRVSIGAVVAFMASAAVAGIIGNRADFLFVWLWGLITTAGLRAWVIILLLLLLISWILIVFRWRHNRSLSHGLDTIDNVVKLDDSLLRLIPSLISAQDREGEMKRLLVELLRDATRAFAGDVHRASILLPDTSRDHLRVWAHYQMPEESVARLKFYIGQEVDRKRGVAGEVFLDSQLRVVHIKEDNGHWKPDTGSYIVFDAKRPYPPYRSFVSVPIVVGEETTDCLGVVCFDSENLAAFDPPEIQYLLLKLGNRIAAGLLIYQHLPSSFRQFKHLTEEALLYEAETAD
jgi:hypothetical protein